VLGRRYDGIGSISISNHLLYVFGIAPLFSTSFCCTIKAKDEKKKLAAEKKAAKKAAKESKDVVGEEDEEES
jgi:hypothetical protein